MIPTEGEILDAQHAEEDVPLVVNGVLTEAGEVYVLDLRATHDFPTDLEPQVSLSMPSDMGLSPVEAVEDFIAYLENGSARLYVYTVQYGSNTYRVDMEANPPIVTKVEL